MHIESAIFVVNRLRTDAHTLIFAFHILENTCMIHELCIKWTRSIVHHITLCVLVTGLYMMCNSDILYK